MAITNLKVNTDRMKGDSGDLTSRLNDARNQMKELSSAMETLLSYWDGPAKEAEQKVFQAEQENITQLFQLFKDLIDELESDAIAYVNCESEVADTVNALNV